MSKTDRDTNENTGKDIRDLSEEEERLRTTRRNAAKFFAALGGSVAIGSFAVTGLFGMDKGGLSGGPNYNYTNIYTKGTKLVTKKGKPIKIGSIKKGSGNEKTVFPKKKGGGALKVKPATTLLARFPENKYQKPTHVKWTVKGYCAYSAVCTHEGCIVSRRAGPHNWYFHCPCHQSTYDPLKGCKVVGGPAPRPVPQLPIGITKGKKELIVATGPFEGPIGPQ